MDECFHMCQGVNPRSWEEVSSPRPHAISPVWGLHPGTPQPSSLLSFQPPHVNKGSLNLGSPWSDFVEPSDSGCGWQNNTFDKE